MCHRAAGESPAASLDEGEVLHGAAVGGGNAVLGTAERSHAALNLAAYNALTGSSADDVMAAAGQAAALAVEGVLPADGCCCCCGARAVPLEAVGGPVPPAGTQCLRTPGPCSS